MRVWGAAVKEMAAALIQQFPQYEEDFQKNADQILSEMEELDRWAVRSLSTIPEKSLFSHRPQCVQLLYSSVSIL